MIQYIFIGTWVDVESVKAFVIAIFYSTQKRSDKRAIDIVQVSRIRFRVYARAGGGGYDVEVEMCYKVWVWISNLLALKLNTNKKGLASWYHSVIDLRPNAFYRILVSYGRRNDASFIVQSFSYHHREHQIKRRFARFPKTLERILFALISYEVFAQHHIYALISALSDLRSTNIQNHFVF